MSDVDAEDGGPGVQVVAVRERESVSIGCD